MLSIGAADLYYNVPGTFINGESQAKGFGATFTGVYLGAAAFLSVFSMVSTAPLSEFMSLADLVRMNTALFGLIATPQGFANLFASPGGYAAWR